MRDLNNPMPDPATVCKVDLAEPVYHLKEPVSELVIQPMLGHHFWTKEDGTFHPADMLELLGSLCGLPDSTLDNLDIVDTSKALAPIRRWIGMFHAFDEAVTSEVEELGRVQLPETPYKLDLAEPVDVDKDTVCDSLTWGRMRARDLRQMGGGGGPVEMRKLAIRLCHEHSGLEKKDLAKVIDTANVVDAVRIYELALRFTLAARSS